MTPLSHQYFELLEGAPGFIASEGDHASAVVSNSSVLCPMVLDVTITCDDEPAKCCDLWDPDVVENNW
jgi:hypothetical protein